MAATDTVPVIDWDTLLDSDEPLQCEHHQHGDGPWRHIHGGPATSYAQVVHNCPARPNAGYVYPVCAPFTAHIIYKYGHDWMCNRCKEIRPGREMLIIIAPIS